MATIHRLPVREAPDPDTLLARLAQLLKLEVELGMAEVRHLVRSAVLAIAVAIPAAVAAVAAIVPRDRRRRRPPGGDRHHRVERVASAEPVVAQNNAHLRRGDLAMARSTAEIQADIALTRRLIESQLDALENALQRRWWMPYAVLGGGLAAGLLLSRLPLLTLVGAGARTVQAAMTVAGALAAVDWLVAERQQRRAA